MSGSIGLDGVEERISALEEAEGSKHSRDRKVKQRLREMKGRAKACLSESMSGAGLLQDRPKFCPYRMKS
jgi:hypothetical protein